MKTKKTTKSESVIDLRRTIKIEAEGEKVIYGAKDRPSILATIIDLSHY